MNISMNNINFCGQREVMYGLSMAAKEARNSEICLGLMQGPRPLNRSAERKTSEALSKAYMIMAAYDDSFYSTLKEYGPNESENLKNILKPEIIQNTKINPIKLFKNIMLNSLMQHNKPIDAIAIDDVFKKIEDTSIII